MAGEASVGEAWEARGQGLSPSLAASAAPWPLVASLPLPAL